MSNLMLNIDLPDQFSHGTADNRLRSFHKSRKSIIAEKFNLEDPESLSPSKRQARHCEVHEVPQKASSGRQSPRGDNEETAK
jgi:hypothetical protein